MNSHQVESFISSPSSSNVTRTSAVAVRQTSNNFQELPRELKQHIWQFLDPRDLLSHTRLVNQEWQTFTKEYLHWQKIRLHPLISPKARLAGSLSASELEASLKNSAAENFEPESVLKEPALVSLLNRFKYFSVLFKTISTYEPQSFEILDYLSKVPYKDLQVNMYPLWVKQLTPERHVGLEKLNDSFNITDLNLVVHSQVDAGELSKPLNFPNLTILIAHFYDRLSLFAPLPNLVDYQFKNIRFINHTTLRLITEKAPNLEKLYLSVADANLHEHPQRQSLNLQDLKLRKLVELTLQRFDILDENLYLRENFPSLKRLDLRDTQALNLQDIKGPSSTVEFLGLPPLVTSALQNLVAKLPVIFPQLKILSFSNIEDLNYLTPEILKKFHVLTTLEIPLLISNPSRPISPEELAELSAKYSRVLSAKYSGVEVKVGCFIHHDNFI